MRTPEVDAEFEFSKSGGLMESIHQQMNYGGNYVTSGLSQLLRPTCCP